MTTNNTQTAAIIATVLRTSGGQAGGLVLDFSNGKRLDVNPNTLSHDVIAEALVHGLKQKLVDAAAISRNTDTGRSATVDDKYEAVKEVLDRLVAGQWNKTRASGEGSSSSGGLLFKALCQMYSTKTPEQVRAFLAGKSKEEQAALRANTKVAAIIAEIKAREAKDKKDDGSDELLAGLEG